MIVLMMDISSSNNRTTNKAVIVAALLLIMAVLYLLAGIFFGFYIPCPFRAVTGFKCPGCGLSHAATHLAMSAASLFANDPKTAQLFLKNAFTDNAMFPLFYWYIIIMSWLGFRSEVSHDQNPHGNSMVLNILNVIMLVIVLAWWVFRNVAGY